MYEKLFIFIWAWHIFAFIASLLYIGYLCLFRVAFARRILRKMSKSKSTDNVEKFLTECKIGDIYIYCTDSGRSSLTVPSIIFWWSWQIKIWWGWHLVEKKWIYPRNLLLLWWNKGKFPQLLETSRSLNYATEIEQSLELHNYIFCVFYFLLF